MNTPNDPKGAIGATMQPETTSHCITFKLMNRLASENPRIVEYCFSDRPDEIFTDRDILMRHRGLTLEQQQHNTMTWILPKQLHTLASVQDTEALISDLAEQSQICAQSLFERGSASMGNATSERPQERSSRSHDSPIQAAQCGSGGEGERQAQPALGRDSDRSTDWMDDAELYTSCENRTDELRLLGNGVVPATAERAFRTLLAELIP